MITDKQQYYESIIPGFDGTDEEFVPKILETYFPWFPLKNEGYIKLMKTLTLSNDSFAVGDFCINLATNSFFIIEEIHEDYWDVKFLTGGNIAGTIRLGKESHAEPYKIILVRKELTKKINVK